MEPISKRDFFIRQPSFPEEKETDEYYLGVARKLSIVLRGADSLNRFSDGMLSNVALNLTGYLQDIISDAGVWRGFVTGCRELYGYTVPFHKISDDYVDYELNREDVKFLIWYFIAMLSDENRAIYPHDSVLMTLADAAYEYMESIYEDAPEPEDYNIGFGLDFKDAEDQTAIYQLCYWLFVNSYLMPPAFAMNMNMILESDEVKGKDGDIALTKMIEEAILQSPTGPLALFTPEWAYLMLHGHLPHEKAENKKGVHPYYEAFTKATGGEEIKFFATYDEMNEFFIEALGWEKGEKHLEMAQHDKDFVLLVNKERGMLMARNVAKCIAAPMNPLYDKKYAEEHAFECLAMRGRCPADLVKYVAERGWLPDAVFPGTKDSKLVAENWDFISRCYLLEYYRD